MDQANHATDERLLMSWENRVKLLMNPTIWSSMLLVIGIPSGLLGLFFTLLTGQLEYLVFVPLACLGGLLAIFVLVALVIDAFGGMKATFYLTTHGVRFVSGKGASAAATAAFLAGLLAGKPGLTGTGLLAESEQHVFISWSDISTIQIKAARHYILIKRGWGDRPIGLYCTPENFRPVMDTLRARAGDRMPFAS